MSEIVYLNGIYIPKDEAFISPDDRGFNFADGIYEVIKYYQGSPFRYNDHIARLKRSLKEVYIEFDEYGRLETVFSELLKQNNLEQEEAGVYLQISRGSHARIHRFPGNIAPTVYATAFPFSSNPDHLKNGVKIITADDIRWLRCDIKSISLLPNVLAAQKAYENQAVETIFIRDGIVTEGSHSSFLAVKDETVYTHPDSNLILPGITKKVVIEICKTFQVKLIETGIFASQLPEMDEMMIAGTGSEITPVVRLNEMIVGNGEPGPVTRFIQEKFLEMTR